MPKPKFPYAGDAALKRLLERYRCPLPFAKPPGPEDAAMLAELGGIFPEVDRAVQADLNAIAVAVAS